ncbi:MAG: hypothetical protein ACKOFG_00835 [Limnohabitans sp.]|jgi:hypothetical protein
MRLLLLLCGLLLGPLHVRAQPLEAAEDVPARIAVLRDALIGERQAIEAQHDARQRDCWQRFAVNDCLREVRRSRHAALDPLRTRELDLNAQEREWRTRQREERLQSKQNAGQQP